MRSGSLTASKQKSNQIMCIIKSIIQPYLCKIIFFLKFCTRLLFVFCYHHWLFFTKIFNFWFNISINKLWCNNMLLVLHELHIQTYRTVWGDGEPRTAGTARSGWPVFSLGVRAARTEFCPEYPPYRTPRKPHCFPCCPDCHYQIASD